MDFFSLDSGRNISFREMTVTKQVILSLIVALQLVCFAYNVVMLMAVYKNRKNTYVIIPLSYVTVMSLSGILVTIFMTINMLVYMVLNEEQYEVYLGLFGAEATIGSTFSYLNTIMVTVLMTIHRVSIIVKPFNTWFTHSKVFIYSAFIAIMVLVSLLIPYFSNCTITFMLNRLAFVSACAPDRHPITWFQNTYTIILPLSCMVINVGIIAVIRLRGVSLKQFLNKVIGVIGCCICRNSCANSNKIGTHAAPATPASANVPTTPSNANPTTSQKTRKEAAMIRQTLSVAIFLSTYELGAFITRVFPNSYTGLPMELRDAYFYFRMESIAFMNFLIYYVNTPITRRMFHSYLGFKQKTTVANGSVLTIAQRIAQQSQTIRMT